MLITPMKTVQLTFCKIPRIIIFHSERIGSILYFISVAPITKYILCMILKIFIKLIKLAINKIKH